MLRSLSFFSLQVIKAQRWRIILKFLLFVETLVRQNFFRIFERPKIKFKSFFKQQNNTSKWNATSSAQT